MKNKHYRITLKHDNGNVTLSTFAPSIESAKRAVCNAESAPLSAVQFWAIVPTAAQVRKTKSLLRGL